MLKFNAKGSGCVMLYVSHLLGAGPMLLVRYFTNIHPQNERDHLEVS